MKKILVVCLLVCATPAWADEGDDLGQIPSCGSVNVKTDIWQGSGLRIDGYTQSSRNQDGCFSKMRVEAYINGYNSGVFTNEGFTKARRVSVRLRRGCRPAPELFLATGSASMSLSTSLHRK